MTKKELKEFLDAKVLQYNQPEFIGTDPIQIPRKFTKKEDIEIAGFLTATISWGNRKSILNNASKMMNLLDNAPHEFIINHNESDLLSLEDFVHRTYNGDDFKFFIKALQNIYLNYGGLESVFTRHQEGDYLQSAIHNVKKIFFEIPHLKRTQKHFSDPLKNSAAKRINMYLRWMVRPEDGVDFGLWKALKPSMLSCPLDVHSGRVARKLKLLKRSQNDGKALAELDQSLRKLDPEDPVKYDFALFGLGVFIRLD